MSAAEKLQPAALNDNSIVAGAMRPPLGAGEWQGSHRIGPFGELREWIPILLRLGIAIEVAARLARRAAVNKTGFCRELLAAELCGEVELYRAIAEELGIEFRAELDPAQLKLSDADFAGLLGRGESANSRGPILLIEPDRAPTRLVGSGFLDLAALRQMLAANPGHRRWTAITTPNILRAAVKTRAAAWLAERACDRLAREIPDCSAKIVVSGWQGCAIGALLMAIPMAFVLWPWAALLGLHLFFSLFFLAGIILRMRAARAAQPPYLEGLPRVSPRKLPTYSVMIALYREAEVVPELMEALGRLVWPRAKLEIKLVCEADDSETLAALKSHALRPWVEIIEVPALGPRTKPKALAYALPMTSGDLVAIYDAEDKPHPLQLVEAWQTFQRSPPELACLQAPLVITNTGEGMIPRMFGFEYAALFRGLLPWLARKGLVLPLGGTSNHFRREALDAVGAWDPFNVTEDADLGLRLARFGYRAGTITYPTFEEAPASLKHWVPQRTRWFKGWLQTWLVHMRHPLRLWRELGTGSFLLVQVLFAGMVISAAAHPILLATLAGIVIELIGSDAMDARHSLLFAVDAINITCGYAAFLALGLATLTARERKGFWKLVLATPIYWMMISFAAWRAGWHLYVRPFHWEKTPHRQSGAMWAKRLRKAA